MIAYACIIAGVAAVGLSFLTGSPWKGFCYTIWAFGALAFWAGIYVALVG